MKKYINPISIISEIRMLRTANNNQTYFLVEGESDERFFNKFIERSVCKVKDAKGRENVEKLMEVINCNRMQGVVAVVDSDFDKVLDRNIDKDNILMTDTHDIETLIIKTDTLEYFYSEYGDYNKIKIAENKWKTRLIEKILTAAKVIGLLRLLSILDNMNLDFKDLNYDDFINRDMELDINKFVTQVAYNSGKIRYKDDIINKLNNQIHKEYDIWQVCCGHDLTRIIAMVLSDDFGVDSLGNKSAQRINSTIVESALRLSYDEFKFFTTGLYKGLVKWQENNSNWMIFNTKKSIVA